MKLIRSLLGVVAAVAVSFFAHAAPDATEIVRKVDRVLWGEATWSGEVEMSVVRPDWTRTLAARNWTLRTAGKSFARITSPAKDAGTGSLVLGDEMWNYFPAIERTVKIPPSMRLQPWMGSDVTNDDMMQRGSMLTSYTHKLLREAKVDGIAVYEVELLPKPDAVIAWGRIVLVARKDDGVPLRHSFYDERGGLVREMVYSDIKSMGGHVMPTHWEVLPVNKPGHKTVVHFRSVTFDQPIPDEVFTLRNLTKKN